MGDLARTSRLITDARAQGPVFVVDAGSLLYARTEREESAAHQDDRKADLLATTYRDVLKVDAVGLGPWDLAHGAARVAPPRSIVNLQPGHNVALASPHVTELGGVKVGAFAVTDLDVLRAPAVTEPSAAGLAAIASLQQAGAQYIVALVQAKSKAAALRLAATLKGVNLVVVGLVAEAPEPEHVATSPEEISPGMYVVIPGERGQVVSRIDVMWQGAGPVVDGVGPAAAEAAIETLSTRVKQMDADYARWQADPSADPAFLATRKRERAELQKELEELRRSPWQRPSRGSYFALSQLKIKKSLACHAEVNQAFAQYRKALGEQNLAFAKTQAVPPVPKGTATYVGDAVCAQCHEEAVAFWKTTRHAHAWETLVKTEQQYDLDCIGCHVTGWGKPSGATVANNATLQNVQCETCHAAGSFHVREEGLESPPAIMLSPTSDLCATTCHTKEHSDTFDFDPYLRDVLGPGHGEAKRKALGDGPTGHSLREAAKQKAGAALGEGCSK